MGLEPATSGVTGQSWRLRPGPGLAGISGKSMTSRLSVAGIRGYWRELPAGSCGMSARWGVVSIANENNMPSRSSPLPGDPESERACSPSCGVPHRGSAVPWILSLFGGGEVQSAEPAATIHSACLAGDGGDAVDVETMSSQR